MITWAGFTSAQNFGRFHFQVLHMVLTPQALRKMFKSKRICEKELYEKVSIKYQG